jgi:hypothetical protein
MNEEMQLRNLENLEKQKNLQKSILIRMSSAFLGVSSARELIRS